MKRATFVPIGRSMENNGLFYYWECFGTECPNRPRQIVRRAPKHISFMLNQAQTGMRLQSFFGALGRFRQPDREHRALAGLAFDGDPSVLARDQRLADRETEAGAFAPFRGEERIEDLPHHV